MDDTKSLITRQELWYWLCNLPGIGQVKLTRLLKAFLDPLDLFYCKEAHISSIEGIKAKDIAVILETRNIDHIRKKLQELERKNIQFYSYEDCQYPVKLRNMYDPPYGLYGLGALPNPDLITIAIVGTRNCSPYGREVARYFSKTLAQAGVQIISGMARGIDSYGHLGALEANGYTLAVLGSGIDYCYPKENIELYIKLEEKCGILSEYGPGVLPKAGHFPMRNRIISGLCDGILVIEAKAKSGSLITADQGLEQGKDIFSIPGRICDPLSAGTNQLIKYGAMPISSPEEILEYYNLTSHKNILNEDKRIINGISLEEKKVLHCLSQDPVHVNTLTARLTMDMGELMKVLLQLEMKQVVAQTSKNYYIRRIIEA